MTTPTDLLALFTAEFGTGEKTKKTTTPKATSPKKPKPSEYSDANRIAQLMSFSSPWKPTAIIAHIIQQTCVCCGGEVESIGNILIRHEHRVTHSLWDCAMPPTFAHALLPRSVHYHEQTVSHCPTCFRLEISQCEAETHNRQLSLF